MTLTMNRRAVLASFAFAAFAFTATAAFADEPKVPTTVAEHEALAKQYKDQAAQFRKLADEHKQMATAYGKPAPGSKNEKNSWNPKMVKHCQQIVKDAEELAADADKAADFHTLRAKELQGK